MAHRSVLRRIPIPRGEILQFGCLEDNYGYLLRHLNYTIAIDVPEDSKYLEILKKEDMKLTHCLITHHHYDHAGGVEGVRKAFPDLIVYGSGAEEEKLPKLTKSYANSDTFSIGDIRFDVFDTPGHTLGHVCYHLPEEKCVFTGDTVFVMGCGRMFEGNPTQFFDSLSKISSLPPETKMFCGHEYSEANAKFAQSVDKSNNELALKAKEVQALRKEGIPTVPSTIGEENSTNPFFRVKQLAAVVGGENDVDTFAKLRQQKDNFRGA